jgi:predicted MPP superfamily phosphohydrolase
VICILGDLVIQGVLGGRFVAPEEIARELNRLHAPSGTVAVLGNHDGWFDHDRVRDALEHNSIRILEDTAARLNTPAGGVWVAASAISGRGGTISTPHCQQLPAMASRCCC